MVKATTLDEALDVLDPRPLEFGAEKVTPGTDPSVYTTPPLPDHGERKRMGVASGESRGDVRRHLERGYPVPILSKAPATFDPEVALAEDGLPFFRIALSHRVAPGVFDDAAVRLAAVYSGGVVRDFFHLLRESILIARYNDLDAVDGVTMRETLRDAQFRESVGLYAPDWEALHHVHRTHTFRSAEDWHYLDEGRVLECYDDVAWFAVHPLLWKLLVDRAESAAA